MSTGPRSSSIIKKPPASEQVRAGGRGRKGMALVWVGVCCLKLESHKETKFMQAACDDFARGCEAKGFGGVGNQDPVKRHVDGDGIVEVVKRSESSREAEAWQGIAFDQKVGRKGPEVESTSGSQSEKSRDAGRRRGL